jgi:hypothetical protein
MKCEHCPLKDDPMECAAHCSPMPLYCDYVNPDHPKYHEVWASRVVQASKICQQIRNSTPTPPKEFNILTQGVSFGMAAFRHMFGGFQTVEESGLEQRISICEACPSKLFDPDKRICNSCGCYVDWKARWATESCPKSHWGTLTSVPNNDGEIPRCGGCGKNTTTTP